MKIPSSRRHKPGFVSYVLVLSTAAILTTLMIYAYKHALAAHQVEANVQLRLDYAEKEETILRSIVAMTPNRAIRAMQGGSNANATVRNALSWKTIFTDSITLSNAGTSISNEVVASLAIPNLRISNSGDSALATPYSIFNKTSANTAWVTPGINKNFGAGYPAPLSASDSSTKTNDAIYPIISSNKTYGSLARSVDTSLLTGYDGFNRLTYPNINFGYARPGDPFVAKRNWWSFNMNLGANDSAKTDLNLAMRNFVVSIYEIPSQLAISASSFMSLGTFSGSAPDGSGGDAWDPAKVSITGNVFASKADVQGSTAIAGLSSRRGITLSSDSSIGGQSFGNSPFAPGTRENYQLTQGDFFPVSLASESGRAAFIPINRGADFFDRFSSATESNALSSSTWNNYSVGALQCAMRLDITQCTSATNNTPTAFRFSYMKNGNRVDLPISLTTGAEAGLPPGYIYCAGENDTYNFGTNTVDLAYGKNSSFAFQTGINGSVTFNNARFGDPLVGTVKYGYYKPSYPFEVKLLPSGKLCIAVYPKRFKNFISLLGGDSLAVNNSFVVNVDYTSATGSVLLSKPSIPCTDLDYGVILQECDDLTSFTKGFSLVTNLRLYIGDDFNTVAATPPTGYPAGGTYYPPCSLFTPEKRYGVEADPFAISLTGQIGSLASDTAANPVRPLDSKTRDGNALDSSKITVNLRPIIHPADLPPITMMNWLILIEERNSEYY